MAAKRGADSQLTKDADSDEDGISVGSQLGGGQKATAAQLASRRLAKARGRRAPIARPHVLPNPGMPQQQSFPSPFSQIMTNTTNGMQQQQPSIGFGQQAQPSNGTQDQTSMSFPPFATSSNGNASTNASTSFPQTTSTFNFKNDQAQYITNPFLPNADPPQTRFDGFQGDIFRILPDSISKEQKKKRDEEGQQAPKFAIPGGAPHKRQQKKADDYAEKWFKEGQQVPLFAAHSPFHHNQQGASDSTQSQPASDSFATPSGSAQPMSNVFGNPPPTQHFPSNFFGQSAPSNTTFGQVGSMGQQPQASGTQQTGGHKRKLQDEMTSTSFEQSSSIFQEPQSSQANPNLFAHIGTPQASSAVFGQAASNIQQPQVSQQQQTGDHTPRLQTGTPSTTSMLSSSVFQQSQPAQTQPNYFAHLAPPLPQAQQSDVNVSQSDQNTMSTSPDSSRPFDFLSQPKPQQLGAQGRGLFDPISKPEEPSKETAPPGGSLFDRVSKPEGFSKESTSPAKGNSLFDRVSFAKPDENPAAQPSDSTEPAENGLSGIKMPHTAQAPASLFAPTQKPSLETPQAPASLFAPTQKPSLETPQVPASLFPPTTQKSSLETPQAPASLFAPTQQSSLETPQAPSSMFAPMQKSNVGTPQAPSAVMLPSQRSSLPASINDASGNDPATTKQPPAPPATQKTNGLIQTSFTGQRTYGVCPTAPSEFTENERRDLTTGWRLKALEVGLHHHLHKNPGNVEQIKKFYMYSKQRILDANGGPLQIPNAEGKRKMGEVGMEANGKRVRVDPRKPLEGPNPGQRRKFPDTTDELNVKKARIDTPQQPLQGPRSGQKQGSPEPEEERKGKKVGADSPHIPAFSRPETSPQASHIPAVSRPDTSPQASHIPAAARPDPIPQAPHIPAVSRPDTSPKRKSMNDEDDEGDEMDSQAKRARFDEPSKAPSSPKKKHRGREMRPGATSGTVANSQTASIFQNIMSGQDSSPNISGHLALQEDKEEDQQPDDKSPGHDHTWKPESPITFAKPESLITSESTSPSPKPAFGGLFGSSTPIAKSPGASLGFAFTPANALSKTRAQSSITEADPNSHATSPSASNGKTAKESEPTAETPSKPVFNFFSPTPAKSASVNLGFTPANATSKALAQSLNTESDTISHATSSSTSTEEIAKESKTTVETPIKPAFSFLNPTPAKSANVNMGFTPANATSKSLAPPAMIDSATTSRTTIGEIAKESKTTVETPIKPAFSFLNPTFTKSVNANMGFTPANATSNSLAPPSMTDSATTSRATSPGATTGESATESNADDEDQGSQDAQVDRSTGGPGEENEDTLFQVKAKAMVYNPVLKQWPIKGLGPFRILKHKQSGKTRMLMRQEPSGKIILNSALGEQLKYESKVDKGVRIPILTDEGKIEAWVIRTGRDDAAKKIASLLEEHK